MHTYTFMRRMSLGLLAIAIAAPLCAQTMTKKPGWLPAEAHYDPPLLPKDLYDLSVPTPQRILGFELGAQPVTHAQMWQCLEAWSASPRMTLHEYARTHEGRPLYYAVITSPENHARLDSIRAAIGKLADPRKLANDAEAQTIIAETPAIAWMAYNIHGDEISSTDAALIMIYQLVADPGDEVRALLNDLVIVVDPLMNPDGRDRYLEQLREFNGYMPNLDAPAMQHEGRWPYGRGNHYLFDLNRDFMLGVHPESIGRQKAISQWHPQLLVDSHEMGAYSTYLFNPPREPINPNITPAIRRWWNVFAADQARAFDAHGWSYYTREWLEFWYPGYSDAWAALHGAVGLLYEQAGVGGGAVRQPTDNILTFKESVHHHLVSSLANLQTLREHRREILGDFLAHHRAALAESVGTRAFLLKPGPNAARDVAFLTLLLDQGVEINVARAAFSAANTTDILGHKCEQLEFPAGTYIVPVRQPAGLLVKALLGFDPHMTDAALRLERESLEAKRESRMYDVTAWSLPLAYAVDGYWAETVHNVAIEPLTACTPVKGSMDNTADPVAYVVDGADDSVCQALAYLLQADVKVRVADKEFTSAGRKFVRGSLLVRRIENALGPETALQAAARTSGAHIYAAGTGRSPDEGPDLGGDHFILLQRPRVALFGTDGISTTAFGEIWHLLDADIGYSISLLNVHQQRGVDLRRYNVVVLPPADNVKDIYGPMVESLKTWVQAGGTLITIGNATDAFISDDAKFSSVRRRRDVLPKLGEYELALAMERLRGKRVYTADEVWAGTTEEVPTTQPDAEKADAAKLTMLDEWRQVFSPAGVILRGELDPKDWLTVGCPAEMPVFFSGSTVYMAKHPVRTPVRLAEKGNLRLSGLLWPEAVTRIESGAYVTVERIGSGQMIAFAARPDFRGYYHGTRRLLINAVLLGPGCGTSQPVPEP